MERKHFFVRLLGPRPTFPWDITEAERALMAEHVKYSAGLFEAGKIIAYGPVLSPRDAYGMGVFEGADEAEVRALLEADPSVKGGLNRYEVTPMRLAAARALDR